MNHWLKIILITAASLGGVTTTVTPANAADQGRVVATTKVAKRPYHATKRSAIYASTKLTKVRATATTRTNYYVTKQATIKKDGKRAVYNYVTAKKANGWVKHSSLKPGKVTVKSHQFNVQAANQAFLAEVNQYRQQHNLGTVAQDAQYQKLAMQRASELYRLGFEQYNAQDKPYAQLDAQKLGIKFEPTSCPTCLYGAGPISESISATSGYQGNQAKVAAKIGRAQAKDLLYHAVEGAWDNRNNLVRSNSKKMGIGWFSHDGMLYLAVNAEVINPTGTDL